MIVLASYVALALMGIAGYLVTPQAVAQERIISDRPPKEEPPPAEIAPSDQSAVQVHGQWVDELSQCRSAMDDEQGSGVYLTDTLLRWGQNTCSIRNISKTAQGAVVDAMCVSDTGRRSTTFTLARQAPDSMRIISANGIDTADLVRCPEG